MSKTQSAGNLGVLALVMLVSGCWELAPRPVDPVVCYSDDDSCPDGTFCQLDEGQCSETGVPGTCEPFPEVCTTDYTPVCGCDGTTYGNSCAAYSAGQNIAHLGECGEPRDTPCGGDLDVACPTGEYCELDDGQCSEADAVGTCQPLPQACNLLYSPVCGCDGVTYGNRCAAASAGQNIVHAGECEEQSCGGIAGLACPEGQFCLLADGQCSTADAMGTCQPLLRDGPCTLEYAPVCGCDGITYGNRCGAVRNGQSVDYEGECEDKTCGGSAGQVCPEGFFCQYSEGQCEWVDGRGTCQPLQTDGACTTDYTPVCGCNGTTYGNQCEATRSGQSVAHAGECGGPLAE